MRTLYRYRFDAVTFDEAKLELVVNGLLSDIQPKPLKVLAELLAAGGAVVTRTQLIDALWGGMVTVPNVLPNAINKLRTALGESGSRIENLPRSGYRFVGPVTRTAVRGPIASTHDLARGRPVPRRSAFILDDLLGHERHEVWLAHSAATKESRVYKFVTDVDGMVDLKREAVLSRVLFEQLGPRADLVKTIGWNFDSLPYFVELEYGGENLLAWSEAGDRLASLPLETRLSFVARIADAVAAAHSVGVLHKDIKPSNVLIAPDSDGWQIRLSDFGSGHLIDPERMAAIGVTSLGVTSSLASTTTAQGTVMYAAPELFGTTHAPSVKSDVYALGVLLYQLTIGDLRRPLLPGWERDVPDPLVAQDIAHATDGDPQLRMSGVSLLAEALRTLPARHAELERSRAEAARIAEDRAALARTKARRPWLIATFGIVVAAFTVSLYFYVDARRTQRVLARQVEVTSSLNQFLAEDLIAQANPSVSGRADVTVVEAVKKAASQIDQRFGVADASLRATLHYAMQQAFNSLNDSASSVIEGVATIKALDAQSDGDEKLRIPSLLTLALARIDVNRLDEADANIVEARRRIAELAAADPLLTARLRYVEGYRNAHDFKLEAALVAYRDGLSIAESTPKMPDDLREQLLFYVADTERMSNDLPEAEHHMRELIALQVARFGINDPRPCYANVLLGLILGYEERAIDGIGHLKPAIACLTATLGPEAKRTLQAIDALGSMQFKIEDFAGAQATWSGLVEPARKVTAVDSPWTLNLRINIGLSRFFEGHFKAAESEWNDALVVAKRRYANDAPQVQHLRFLLAASRLEVHETNGVQALLDGLDVDALKKAQITSDWTGRLAFVRGKLALEQGRRSDAQRWFDEAADNFTANQSEGWYSAARVKDIVTKAGLKGDTAVARK